MAVLLWRTAKTKYCCPFGREKEGDIVYRPYMTTRQLAKIWRCVCGSYYTSRIFSVTLPYRKHAVAQLVEALR
jgi:hypothetical protein